MDHNLKSSLISGLLPLILYSIVEYAFGLFWGLIAALVFAVFEIIYEKMRLGKIQTLTWISNALIVVLGVVSLLSQEGIWFKLQPALLEILTSFSLWGSLFIKKPFLITLAHSQNLFQRFHPLYQEKLKQFLARLTFRLGIFFAIHSVLAVIAALYLSTWVWVTLKGVGLTLSLILYFGLEIFMFKKTIQKSFS